MGVVFDPEEERMSYASMTSKNVEKFYIEDEDLKERYRHHDARGEDRLGAVIKSFEESSGVNIVFSVKSRDIVEITLSGENNKSVRENLQGELCSPTALRKLELPIQQLPSKHIKDIKPSKQAHMPLSSSKQKSLGTLTVDALEKHDLKNSSGPLKLRQFACPICWIDWWRTVLKTKPVSRCKGAECGQQRYDPVPKDKEFGAARFLCSNCENEFYKYCEFKDTSACKKCGYSVRPYIHPRWRDNLRKWKKTLNPNAKAFQPQSRAKKRTESPDGFRNYRDPGNTGPKGPNFEPASKFRPIVVRPGGYPYPPTVVDSVVPKFRDLGFNPPNSKSPSLQEPERVKTPNPPSPRSSGPPDRQPRKMPRIFNASAPHAPTGSTISTFLSQLDFENLDDLDDFDDMEDDPAGICKFECSKCPSRYLVLCRMQDRAECYKCHTSNEPIERRDVVSDISKFLKLHCCSRCNGAEDCLNLRDFL